MKNVKWNYSERQKRKQTQSEKNPSRFYREGSGLHLCVCLCVLKFSGSLAQIELKTMN